MNNLKQKAAAIVFGSNINGLSIISELKEKKVKDIILIDRVRNYAFFTSGLKKKIKIEYTNTEILKNTLKKLHEEYSYLVLFPTADIEIISIYKIIDEIKNFCFIPFNEKNVIQSHEKLVQYKFCEQLGIPYPRTVNIDKTSDIENIKELMFPVIIKPNIKKPNVEVFRNLILNEDQNLEDKKVILEEYLNKGITFLASEIIPGSGDNIYAYVGYRSKKGKILNEWIGKKLSQFPDDFGVFASATNQAPETVREQGRKLIEAMDLYGILEPEFKYDHRDGKYKLMEINLRSMMWHRVGNLSGVNLQYTQWLDATGQKTFKQKQNLETKIHFVYLQYELINLFCRKKYAKTFWYNLTKGDRLHLAEFQHFNILTLTYSLILTFLRIIKRCLKL